jgi:hypothetical protein
MAAVAGAPFCCVVRGSASADALHARCRWSQPTGAPPPPCASLSATRSLRGAAIRAGRRHNPLAVHQLASLLLLTPSPRSVLSSTVDDNKTSQATRLGVCLLQRRVGAGGRRRQGLFCPTPWPHRGETAALFNSGWPIPVLACTRQKVLPPRRISSAQSPR